MRKRYHSIYEDRENFSPWESYSDLFCGLLLVFVLLFFFVCYQYIDAKEKNNEETAALQEAMKEEQTSVLALYKADLENQEMAYQEKNRELENQKTALAIVQTDLDSRTELLDQQQALIDQQQSRLEEQQELISGQQKKLDEQQALLDSQAVQIEQIVGVRGQLIDELNRELSQNQIQIQADRHTGAILFESSILFAKDSNELSEEGKAFFKKFMPIYLGVILRDEFQEYIAEIIVEGHTDNTGSYLHNLELSQQRAYSVAEYVLSDGSSFLGAETTETLKSLITVNGCADKDPIFQADGTVDTDRSRRVEIKFRLTDQEMIQEMDEILNKEK